MDQYTLNLLVVGASFALYIGIAIWARAGPDRDPDVECEGRTHDQEVQSILIHD